MEVETGENGPAGRLGAEDAPREEPRVLQDTQHVADAGGVPVEHPGDRLDLGLVAQDRDRLRHLKEFVAPPDQPGEDRLGEGTVGSG